MRILIVSHLGLPHVGGVENLVHQEILTCVAAGYEVVHLTSDGSGRGQMPNYPATVRVVRLPAWHFLERRLSVPYPLFGPTLLGRLWREIKRADVIHVHGFLFQCSVLALLLGRWQGKKCLLTDHGGIQRFANPWVTRLARLGVETVGRLSARLAHRRVAYNQRIGNLLDRLSGRPGGCLFLPNPVDFQLFQPTTTEHRRILRQQLGWSPTRPRILYAGRLIASKGVPLLANTTDPAYDITFCGPGDVSLLGPLPRSGIEYLSPRPQTELALLYQAADVLALPGDIREGFPLVIQEALAAGLEVVTTYDPGYEPYRKLAGLHFCEQDENSLRSALLTAIAAAQAKRQAVDQPNHVDTNNSKPESIQASERVPAQQFFPDPQTWLQQLLGPWAPDKAH